MYFKLLLFILIIYGLFFYNGKMLKIIYYTYLL